MRTNGRRLPFLLSVLSVQFVIVASFDQTDASLPVEERVALALMRCGVSVTCESEFREMTAMRHL